jgi:hypothetical protein
MASTGAEELDASPQNARNRFGIAKLYDPA